MDTSILNLYQELPRDIQLATKLLVESFLYKLYPYLQKIGQKIQISLNSDDSQDNVGINNVFLICVSQIKKSYSLLLHIFQLEYEKQLLLLESRHCTLERLSWCCKRLVSIEERLTEQNKTHNSCTDMSFFSTPMYFVNWIDQTFNILKNITNLVYNINREPEKLFDEWKNKVIECLRSLHETITELLLSAMTLCKHCLPTDQYIIRVRCQVVLTETKSLFANVIDCDIEEVSNLIEIPLKLPIKPSLINVHVEVLKEALYVLETNTNTALLALLVHCFSYNTSPVDILKAHFNNNNKGICVCDSNNETEESDVCNFVKEFDLYNERLVQIGSFALSCSSDDKRILAIRSSLATLEALDPHLVPALMMSPESNHTTLLRNTWNKEVLDTRNSVFLIVDPAAFSEKVKQMMHQTLLEIIKENVYNNSKVCSVINIGCLVFDFFDVYNKCEPAAVNEPEKMLSILADLNKVQSECKVVSDLLSSGDDYVYYSEKPHSAKTVTFQQILKRLKLLYTIINKIYKIQKPEDDNDFFGEEDMTIKKCNPTYAIPLKNHETFVHSPRSNFARTAAGQTPSRIPLFKLTKHLRQKDRKELLVQLDELCNTPEMKVPFGIASVTNFYSPLKTRRSIRAVFDRQISNNENEKLHETTMHHDKTFLGQSVDLQIKDVLHRINDLTMTFSTRQHHQEKIRDRHQKLREIGSTRKINESVTNLFGHSLLDTECLDSEVSVPRSNVSEPSNVSTLERLNDLDLVESKLSDLRVKLFETRL